jgi:hypothetical protein
MVAVFWSFLALSFAVLYSLNGNSIWPIVVSGLLFALAMATYQSTILLAPAAVVLILQAPRNEQPRSRLEWFRLRETGVFVLSGLAGCIAIYGWCYWHSGTQAPVGMLKRFLVHEDARAYFGVTVGKLMSVPIGLVSDIFPVLSNYIGIRHLLAAERPPAVGLLLLIVVLCAFLVSCVLAVSRNWRRLSPPQRIAFEVAAVGFAFTLIPVIVWNPAYDKLWIQPLACLAFLPVLGLTALRHGAKTHFRFLTVTAIVLLVGVCSNLGWVVQSHFREHHEIAEAQRLATIIGNRDLVVGEWDPVSILYGSLWGREGRFISFPTEAVTKGIGVMFHVRDAISETERNGGKVYFLAVLDLPKSNWDAFLGSRCGVPYSELDSYREHSTVRAEFTTRGGEVSLRQLDLPISADKSR